MNQEQNWLAQLREKNRNSPLINNRNNHQRVINNLYLVWDPKSKQISQECRKEMIK